MKILLVSQYFWPESFRINDLALTLKERGNEVTVLTGKPNYPKGKFYKGYGFFSHSRENYNGIKVIRIPIIPRGNGGGIRLALNYISYAVLGSVYAFFLSSKFDISLTFSLSPITSAYPAIIHKRKKGYKTFTWIQDLWPESVTAASNVKSKTVISILEKIVKNIYNNSDKILIQSNEFSKSILFKGIPENKIEYLPNWAEDLYSDPAYVDKTKYKNLIPEGFVIMFAGNIGEAQDFESILKAAELTKSNKNIKWIILGDGRKKDFVTSEIKRRQLEETFLLLGSYPVSEMPSFFIHADIMLVTLKDEYIFSLTIPSKVQSYMATGKPVFSMLDGVGGDVIKEAKCGLTAPAGDYQSLAKNVLLAYNLSHEQLKEYGNNSLKYYRQNFDKDAIIDKLVKLMYSHSSASSTNVNS